MNRQDAERRAMECLTKLDRRVDSRTEPVPTMETVTKEFFDNIASAILSAADEEREAILASAERDSRLMLSVGDDRVFVGVEYAKLAAAIRARGK